MEPNNKGRTALKVIQGGKEPPAERVIGLRADATPDRPRKPLTPKEIEELRVLAGLNPD